MGVSIRAYAKLRGVSDAAVRKAIKTGRISVEQDGSINPAQADTAWEKNTDPGLQRKTATSTPSAPPPAPPPKPPGAPTRTNNDPLPTPDKAFARPTTRPDNDSQDPRVPSYAASRAVKEAYAAKLLRIEYEQKMGNLLEASAVTKEAFEVASRTRDRLEKIPGHVAAALTAMTDRRAIETLLAKEIRSALEEIAK
ncbi:MAG: hypothetical protein HQL92_08290 [Magnetococcales bacterium]|nr:hypothetical protein [Magnetococcales bacterium]